MTKGPTLPSSALTVRSFLLRSRTGDLSFAAVAFTVVFGSLLGIVALQTMIVQNRVELDRVSSQLDEELEINRRLRLEVIELESPDRVLELASDRLGMIRPDERRYLPGIDPVNQVVAQPQLANPFGPRELPDFLIEIETP
ncbi:MAG: cell division protein FtsL [Acidimicrobiales bacterium]|nr:MAG: cell division protein FtsL [Acidimicrobiales bacterium]